MRLLCNGNDGGNSCALLSSTVPLSGSSIPAMHARTVLLPEPEAPNNPSDAPSSKSRETSTMKSRRCLIILALSMAPPLRQHMDQPGKGQSDSEKRNQQGHHRGQSKALKIYPELYRHSRWVIGGHDNGSEFANRAHPGYAERHGKPQSRQRQRDPQKDFERGLAKKSSLLLQQPRHGVESGHSAENVV